jgi:hypothetical protein
MKIRDPLIEGKKAAAAGKTREGQQKKRTVMMRFLQYSIHAVNI